MESIESFLSVNNSIFFFVVSGKDQRMHLTLFSASAVQQLSFRCYALPICLDSWQLTVYFVRTTATNWSFCLIQLKLNLWLEINLCPFACRLFERKRPPFADFVLISRFKLRSLCPKTINLTTGPRLKAFGYMYDWSKMWVTHQCIFLLYLFLVLGKTD